MLTPPKPNENFSIHIVVFEDHAYAYVSYRRLGRTMRPMGRRASVRLSLGASDLDTGDTDSFLVLVGDALVKAGQTVRER